MRPFWFCVLGLATGCTDTSSSVRPGAGAIDLGGAVASNPPRFAGGSTLTGGSSLAAALTDVAEGSRPIVAATSKVNPALEEAIAVWSAGGDEALARHAQEKQLYVEGRRLRLEIVVEVPEDLDQVMSRLSTLGGTPITTLGPVLYAWVPIDLVEELAKGSKVLALSAVQPTHSPMKPSSESKPGTR